MAVVKVKKKEAQSVFSLHLPLSDHKRLAELAHRNTRSIRAEALLAVLAHLEKNGAKVGRK